MTKDEAMKLAQEVCPYFDEISKGAFYDGFITALDHIPDATKMMGLTPSEWVSLTDQKIDELDEKNWGEDRKSWGIHEFARAIEAKLKEKNT